MERKSDREIKKENIGIYELNTQLAAALNLPHKIELDCMDGSNFGHPFRWDQRSINIRYQAKARLREVDFTRNIELLLTYASCYGIDVILSGDKPKVIVNYNGCSEKPEPKEFIGDVLSRLLISAILEHCRILKPEHPQFLIHDFSEKL
ncbi:hypothetical protein LMH73_004795 [Vibrio splendidus]|nr:hypothetical protein [Vibrio splendidus]MCC4882547.1 hypothetical protein [Vibrio splendidus]